MKRIWIALAILLLCLSIAITEFFVIKNKVDDTISAISTACIYFSEKEYKAAAKLVDYSESKWNECEKILNVFLSHEKVYEIDDSISELSKSVQSKDELSFQTDFEKTKRQLLRLIQSELPNFENIM